ncbi:MAG: NBR1-Ig-like domain-containing protein, partial [Bacteroidota bacterium]
MLLRKLIVVLVIGGMLASLTVSQARAATPCNWAQFIADVSVPDGSVFAPGTVFTKTWRLQNIGTCTWTTAYSLAFDSGSQMSGPGSVNLPTAVARGQTVDLSVMLTAPAVAGHYRGFWKLKDAAGAAFGIGSTANGAFWVDIEVQDTASVVYDLVTYAPYAQWSSGAGALPFPGTSGDYRGYAQRLDSLTMEDGAFTTRPSLLTVPQSRYDGYIQAIYPEFTVQQGDRFQAAVGCEYGSSCYVRYQLNYVTASGSTHSFWTRNEMNDGRVYQASVDLSSLAGQTVRFELAILALGSP